MKESGKKDRITYAIMLALGLVFYLLPGIWLSIEDDSAGYLENSGEGVWPGYPAFLSFFRRMFPGEGFLDVVVIAQSLLAVICTFLFVLVLKKQFKLRNFECILFYLLSMMPFSIYLPEVGITHQIMTEGITYAVFYLYFITVMKGVWTLRYRWYIGSMSVAVLLGITRSQMLFLQVTCLLLLIWITYKRFGKKPVVRLGACVFVLGIGVLLLFGSKIQSAAAQFNTVIMARGFYEADEEDVSLFEDDMMREIFARTYELADENGRNYKYAKDGLYMWQELVYDRMNIFAVQAIEEYDENHPGERTRDSASIFFELGIKVMGKHLDRYLYHSLRLMMSSFIATVFFQIQPIYLLCHFIALFLYLFTIAGSIFVKKSGGDRQVVEMSAVIVSVMLIMVVMVNLMFMGLQRYMVYGMGIFYCAMYLLCRELGRIVLGNNKNGPKWLQGLLGENV